MTAPQIVAAGAAMTADEWRVAAWLGFGIAACWGALTLVLVAWTALLIRSMP